MFWSAQGSDSALYTESPLKTSYLPGLYKGEAHTLRCTCTSSGSVKESVKGFVWYWCTSWKVQRQHAIDCSFPGKAGHCTGTGFLLFLLKAFPPPLLWWLLDGFCSSQYCWYSIYLYMCFMKPCNNACYVHNGFRKRWLYGSCIYCIHHFYCFSLKILPCLPVCAYPKCFFYLFIKFKAPVVVIQCLYNIQGWKLSIWTI